MDDDTLGVYVDTDSDGTYETIIADSDGTRYDKLQTDTYEEKQTAAAEAAPSGSPAAETVQESHEPAASADYGFVPWVGAGVIAAVAAVVVIITLRKRRNNTSGS